MKPLLLAALLLLTARGFAQTSPEAAKSAVVAANEHFMVVFARGASGLGHLYTRDAVMYNAHSQPVRGTEALNRFWKSVYDAGVRRMKLETVEVDPAGAFLLETGRFTSYDAAGKALDEGNYLVVWKKEGGAWKLHRDIGNSSRPAAP
jgi:ketosteroid isomerase-like protein